MYKYCININKSLINKYVTIYGWIDNKIILKNLIFIKLRDNTGTIQIVFEKKNFKKNFIKIYNLKLESCIKIMGLVKFKINDNNLLEIIVYKLKIISNSDKLPINLNDNNISNKIKLKFRYLYLRKSNILNNLKIKSDIIWYINYFMRKKNYIYIETPILSKPTINGAKNYIVPSRIKNKFYSLSESPQIFKQILMISGLNKYYQFAKCFRDEDLRSNRQPEFTQLDIESSFINENYIIKLSENLIKFLFKKIKNYKISNIPQISYKESIYKYGTDKPDLRNPIKIFNLINILIENNISIIKHKKYIYILKIPCKINKINIENYTNIYKKKINLFFFNIFNIKKALIKIKKNLYNIPTNTIINILNNNILLNENFTFILIINNKDPILNLGKLSKLISNNLNLINNNEYSLIWIKDFPMFKKNKLNNNLESVHHPFTSPKYLNKFLNKINKPEHILSNSYDLIINGEEISSGSVRINNKFIQEQVFNILNISKKNQIKNFGFFLNALKYGTPNHAGIAFGLDRLTMIFTNSNDIKDVIAFPKTSSLLDLMIDSPSNI